jgi:hypothetical protein
VRVQLFADDRQETRAATSAATAKELYSDSRNAGQMIRRVSAAVCAAACAAITLAPLTARADLSEASAINSGLLAPANASLQRALKDLAANRDGAPADVAQANPVGTPQAPSRRPSLPRGFTYNVDVSFAYPYGAINYNAKMPGGVDAGFGYGFTPTNRLQVGYFETQQFPVGFSNKNVPFFIQGFTGPGTALAGITQNTGPVDATTKDQILTVVDQNLFVIGNKLPIVISPTYLAHTAKIAGGNDTALIEYNGFPVSVRQRTEQEWLLPVTLPFLATPRMFATATVAGQWLNHLSGVNQTNKAQIFLLGYIEYRASKSTTIFFQPSRLVQYNPVDPFPEYTPTFIYGLSHHFTPQTFVQMSVLTGGATNYQELGITGLYCQNLPSCSSVATSRGGLKATTVQIQFGLGSPTVLPL